MRDLRQAARTYEQSVATAKRLYQLADCAMRVEVEQGYQQPELDQSEDESEDEEMSPQLGYG